MKTISDLINDSGIFSDGDWVESKDQDPKGNVRLIQLADIGDGVFLDKSNRFLTEKMAYKLKCTFLEAGDILIARMPDPIGRACIFPNLKEKCVTVVDVCIIRPNNEEVYPPFLKYLINSDEFRHKINRHVTGTTRKRISRGNLNKIKFELPSLPDQIRIATLLSRVEVLIQKRKDSIALLDEYVRSTFYEMFPNLFEGQKEPLNKHLKIQQGYAFKSKDFIKNGIPVIKIGTVNKGFFDLVTMSFLPNSFWDLSPKYQIQPGDLLISMTGTVGKDDYGNTCFVTNRHQRYLLNQRVGKLIPDEIGLNKEFIHYLFQMPQVKRTLIKANRGVRQANLSNNDILKLEINFPPFGLQVKFSQIFEKVELIKIKCEKSLVEFQNLFGSLSQGAFQGKLDLSQIEVDVSVKKPKLDDNIQKAKKAAEKFEKKISTPFQEIRKLEAAYRKGLKPFLLAQANIKKAFQPIKGATEQVKVWNDQQQATFKKLSEALIQGFSFEHIWEMEGVEDYDEIKSQLEQWINNDNPFLMQFFDEDQQKIIFKFNETPKA
jgi:type I restriction enzyme S subunit